jgi:hypothetical protein
MGSLEKYQSIETEKDNFAEQFSYEEYRSLAGKLNQHFFHQSLEFLNRDPLESRKEIYCRVCEHYAALANLALRPEQKYLYAYLRDIQLPSSSFPKDGEGSSYPWQLTDQVLLAEILLLTEDKEAYQKFTDFFSPIF